MDIQPIREQARQRKLFFIDHAVRQMAKRAIMDTDVVEALLNGEIIEEYPEDKYSPSCLVYGMTDQGRPLHVQCSLPLRVRVVTACEPDSAEWIDNRQRK